MSASSKKRKVPILVDKPIGFCPGYGHGIINHLVMECLDELGQSDNIIFPIGMGCSSSLDVGLEYDHLHCSHGRTGAVVTGMKRINPGVLIMPYQGDGDAYDIGVVETFNAAYRNENITVIAVNNTNFGMTDGQMSLTAMEGQKTSTGVHGRNCSITSYPLHFPEMVAREFPGAAYAARGTMTDPSKTNQLEGYIKSGLQAQINHEGYSVIEVLSPCPMNWGLTPVRAMECVESELVPYYPLDEFKKREVR